MSALTNPPPPAATTGRKRKFLFFPMSNVLAHVSHALEIARVLRARGHEVVFAGHSTTHPLSRLNVAQKDGFRVIYAQEPDHAYVWRKFMKWGTIGLYNEFSKVHIWAPIDQIIESQVRAIKDEQPDAVLGAAAISMSNAAYVAGVPALNIINAYLIDFVMGRLPLRLWWNGYDAYHFAGKRKRVYIKHGRKPVKAVPLFNAVPLLSPDLPGMYETSRYLPNVKQVGPILFDFPAPLPEWYGELEDGTPNVYITMGSTGRFDLFLQQAYQHLGRLPYRFVVTTGGQVSEETILRAPTNFRFAKYAPGTDLLKHCSALIFHGGNGSMYQALASGVPMLAFPMHMEQTLNSNIGVKHGFCVQLGPRKANSHVIASTVRELVETPKRREVAQRFAEQIRSNNGAENAATACEEVAEKGIPVGANL